MLTHKLEMRKKQRKNGEYHVRKVSIGILAVQGAFAEHQAMLDGLGADTFLIRQKKGFGRVCAEWRTAGDRASRR